MKEITLRVVVLGLLLSVVMGAANVYVGLKAGMTVSASIPASVMAMLTFFLLCSGDRLAGRNSAWCDDRPLVRGRVAPLVSGLARQMRHYGAVTLVTNLAAGMTGEPLRHDEVLAAGRESARDLAPLLAALLARI